VSVNIKVESFKEKGTLLNSIYRLWLHDNDLVSRHEQLYKVGTTRSANLLHKMMGSSALLKYFLQSPINLSLISMSTVIHSHSSDFSEAELDIGI
jgi:hypothetical protein